MPSLHVTSGLIPGLLIASPRIFNMRWQSPGRHGEDIEPNAGLAMLGIASSVPFQSPFNAPTLAPGDRFHRGGACCPDFNLDRDQAATAGGQNIDFPGPGSIADLENPISFDAQQPLAEPFRETTTNISPPSFGAPLAHGTISRHWGTGECRATFWTIARRFRADMACLNPVLALVTLLPSWPGLLMPSASLAFVVGAMPTGHEIGRLNLVRGSFGNHARVGLVLVVSAMASGCQTTPETGQGGTTQSTLSQRPPSPKPSPASSLQAKTAAAPTPAVAGPGGPAPKPGKLNLLAPQMSPAPTPPEIIERRVAMLVPLSGRGASIGRALLDAAQMALFETAQDDLELLVFDTQGTRDGAEDAARLAVADGARLILGPLFGASAEVVRPIAGAAAVNVVSFSNNRDIAGNGVYVFGFLPDQQVRRVIRHAAASGHARIGALVPSSGFGELVVATARVAAEHIGVNIVRASYYDPTETELSPLIRQFADYDSRKSALAEQKSLLSSRTDQISSQALKRLGGLETLGDPPFDSVLLPAGDPELRGIAPLLAYYDVDPARIRFLGTALWDELSRLGAEPALVGGWYAAPAPESRLVFEDKFKRAFTRRPPRLASLGYDAMLLAVALTYGEGGTDYSPAALTDANGFAGVDGIFRLLADGTNQRGLAIMEVREMDVQVIDPAPTSFTDFQF